MTKKYLIITVFFLLILALSYSIFRRIKHSVLKPKLSPLAEQLSTNAGDGNPSVGDNRSSSSTEGTTDPTAEWETYTNKDYGYEIKFPKDWELMHDKSWAMSPPNQRKDDAITIGKRDTVIEILSGGVSLGSFHSEEGVKVSQVTIGGVKLTRYSYPGLFDVVTFPDGLPINDIRITYGDDLGVDYTEDHAQVEPIISTLRFLE